MFGSQKFVYSSDLDITFRVLFMDRSMETALSVASTSTLRYEVRCCQKYTHTAQNIAETGQKYFQSFITNEKLSQHFCRILKNISSQLYNFNYLKYL